MSRERRFGVGKRRLAAESEVRRVQPEKALPYAAGVQDARPADDPVQPAVFFVVAREAVDSHYERNPADPRVTHGLVLAVDAFGTVLQTAAVAYPRRDPDEDVPEQEALAAACTARGPRGPPRGTPRTRPRLMPAHAAPMPATQRRGTTWAGRWQGGRNPAR